ncbi:MAG: FAD-dependent oxidoreductase [Betaproteobacteria bacterium]|nr:FAD-dependent oxidoreductase [Betaproteobacteria bacterium]
MNVAVIGGGYAGMAAAVTLAERRVPVTVFEAAKTLGGRARRVDYQDIALDNGLHILIGAYRETLRLIALVHGGLPARLLLRLPLTWIVAGHFALKSVPLPAPLHLLWALLAARGAPLQERRRAVRFARAMRAASFALGTDVTVARLLADHRQGPTITRHLWRRLCVSALNTPPETASAQVFLNVLRDGLAGGRADSDILLSRVDLSTLFPEQAARHVISRGGEVVTGRTVEAVRRTDGGFAVSAGNETLPFSHVICALPPHRAQSLISRLPELAEATDLIARFEYQPIYSIYLQYPHAVCLPAPMVGLSSGLTHWVFDRQALCGQRGLLAAVISAGGPHQALPQEELAQRVHRELEQQVGGLGMPLWQRVIAEKRATFACTVGLRRPPHRTPLENFYLAGDYTASDYPATIEAAVRSGLACAELVSQAACV